MAEEFFKTVEDIVLYPGSLDELNRREERAGSQRRYDIHQWEGGNDFLLGLIIPSRPESELVTIQRAISPSMVGGFCFDGRYCEEESFADMRNISASITEMLEHPRIREMDLRWKTKEIGASGLIHFQLYNRNDLYMGVPIVRIE